jgi:hypothetical protein
VTCCNDIKSAWTLKAEDVLHKSQLFKKDQEAKRPVVRITQPVVAKSFRLSASNLSLCDNTDDLLLKDLKALI